MDNHRDQDPSPAARSIGNPLDFIAEDHRRERTVCGLIDRLVALVPISPAERQMALVFLREELPQHLRDEEVDLFPMMLERCAPEDEIERVIDKLTQDHGHAVVDAPAIVALIQSQDDAMSRQARAAMDAFAVASRRHLVLENAIILPIARARLTPGDLQIMKRHMLERRGLAVPGDTEPGAAK
jgi:hypothetical protein